VTAVLDDLLSLLLPGRCPGCGRRAEPVCDSCAARLVPAPRAPAPPPGVAWSASVFSYEGIARELVARVKYRNERAAVRWLGALVAERCRDAPFSPDAVTWVPASRGRRAARGVDHGALLARATGRALGRRPQRLLVRAPGPAQTGRAARDRRTGPVLHAVGPVRGAVVLVVDDVVTTGASLAAAARALHEQGARAVTAVTVARTPPPADRAARGTYTRPRNRPCGLGEVNAAPGTGSDGVIGPGPARQR
jgi:ComF family protein